MEVKIKYGDVMVDATIEMVDGDMVVSPKVEPKAGDVLYVDLLHPLIGIVKEEYSSGKPDKDRLYFSVGYWEQSGNIRLGTFCACDRNTGLRYRPATEEEKKKLFDKLAEEGWEWKADTKELVKLKPKEGEEFWFPLYYTSTSEFRPIKSLLNKGRDKAILDNDWCFKTEQECQEFCNRLNDAINSVKP